MQPFGGMYGIKDRNEKRRETNEEKIGYKNVNYHDGYGTCCSTVKCVQQSAGSTDGRIYGTGYRGGSRRS